MKLNTLFSLRTMPGPTSRQGSQSQSRTLAISAARMKCWSSNSGLNSLRGSRATAWNATNGRDNRLKIQASDMFDGSGSGDPFGTAIELRSRLEELDIQLRQEGGSGGGNWEQIPQGSGAWVRLPAGTRAWGVVHFMGGAVLGSFPHITYDKFLSKVCDDGGLIVIATPYELGTNHAQIAKEAAQLRDQALSIVLSRESYPAALPVFGIGHSLGSKLHVLLASEGEGSDDDSNGGVEIERPPLYSGHVLVAFNNASAVDTVKVLEKFARGVLKDRAESGQRSTFDDLLNSLPGISAIAERAAQAAGIEFVPNPAETLDLARRRLRSSFVKIVKFSDDDLDMNEELVEAIKGNVASPTRVVMSELAGNHLTPVAIKIQGAEFNPALGGLGDFELGDEVAIEQLAAMTIRLLRTA